MKVCCSIFLYDKIEPRFLTLAKNLINSIKRNDPELTISILAPEGHLSEEAKKLPAIIWEESPINRPKQYLPLELTKIQAIKHTEYDVILLIDADCIANESLMSIFGRLEDKSLGFSRGYESPLNAARLLIKPSKEDHKQLLEILENKFNVKSGWNQYGAYNDPDTNETKEWNFNFAHSSQGLLFYYYELFKQSYTTTSFMPELSHIGGGPEKWIKEAE